MEFKIAESTMESRPAIKLIRLVITDINRRLWIINHLRKSRSRPDGHSKSMNLNKIHIKLTLKILLQFVLFSLIKSHPKLGAGFGVKVRQES